MRNRAIAWMFPKIYWLENIRPDNRINSKPNNWSEKCFITFVNSFRIFTALVLSLTNGYQEIHGFLLDWESKIICFCMWVEDNALLNGSYLKAAS